MPGSPSPFDGDPSGAGSTATAGAGTAVHPRGGGAGDLSPAELTARGVRERRSAGAASSVTSSGGMLVNCSGVLSGLALEHRSDSHDGLTVSKASDLDPGRVSALNGYLVRLHPDDIAAR